MVAFLLVLPVQSMDATDSKIIFHEEEEVIEIVLEEDLPDIRWAGKIEGPDGELWSSKLVARGEEGKTVYIKPTEGILSDLPDGKYVVTLYYSELNPQGTPEYEDIVGEFRIGGTDLVPIAIGIFAVVAAMILVLALRKRFFGEGGPSKT